MSGSREETPLRLVGRRTDPVKRTSVTSLPQPLAPPAFTPPTQSPGLVGSSEDGTYPALQVTKVHTRKALIEFTLDYDYGGPNPRHDPRKGKPGRGL